MPGIIRCPSCGQEIDSNSRFCVHCTARICPGCHGPVPPKAVFCPNCGFAVGPGVTSAAEQQPTPMPPSRSFSAPQGGILGPQPGQQHSFPPSQPSQTLGRIMGPQPGQPPQYPQAPSPQTTGAAPGTPIPQPAPSQQYETGDQPTGAAPYVSAQQSSVSTKKTFLDTGPIRVRRFPTALVIVLIIAVIVLPAFAAFQAGWLEAPINSVQEFISGINLPQWLPIGSKDNTPPAISGVNVSSVTQSGAVIAWQTDEPATSQVMICDEGGGCTWTELDETLVTDHSVNISELKASTKYHITATSTDAKGNQAIDETDFTTLAETAVTTLTISGIQVSNITDMGITINWVTDEPATSQVEYGTTNAYGSTTTIDNNLTTSHTVILTGLKPITTYHFKVKSKGAGGEETSSQDQTFTTRSAVSAATEIGPEVGKLAPDFTLPTLDGEQIGLSVLRGKKVMINFWQDVQQSRNELSVIQDVYDKLSPDEVAVLAISWQQTISVAQSVANVKDLTLPILLDETGEVAAKYDVLRSPATFFIDTQGVIRGIKSYPATLKSVEQVESILDSMQ